jgi:hypothetical protein
MDLYAHGMAVDPEDRGGRDGGEHVLLHGTQKLEEGLSIAAPAPRGATPDIHRACDI